ncbi:hypothetical protein [Ramlibacter sp. AN1133]|uniref:hypothetical protein n=1 Tax=Ramlibacter sp. AN1133 TaxID=3133429 RepID=UPI0030C154A7
MTKILPITPSFAAWRCAADRLLTLETSFALHQRTMIPGPMPLRPAQEIEIEQVRQLAGKLFEIARAETERVRGHANAASGPT